jgi:hypothetical protein
MKTVLLSALALMLLAGCVSKVWQKAGASGQETVDAMNVCRTTARVGTVEIQPFADGGTKLMLPARAFDERVFATCMGERGFVRTSSF